jgi:hypothetical protein
MADIWQPGFHSTAPFQSLRPWVDQLTGPDWPNLEQLNTLAERQLLINANGLPVRFATQTQRCGQHDYEAGILLGGHVPTRSENWHDLLNALCWLSLPKTKLTLNAVQCLAIDPLRPQRGPLSDAATLFDESGLVIAGPEASLAQALREKRWQDAFVRKRAAWANMTVIVVGHAILEKLLSPWPGITAKCTFIDLPANPCLETVDAALAKHWLDPATKQSAIEKPADLFPMPVLGVPGWWAANEDPVYYDNSNVFRT